MWISRLEAHEKLVISDPFTRAIYHENKGSMWYK